MKVRAIDHVNIRIPASGVDSAVEFYRDALGFEPEDLENYRDGDRPIFSFRLGETCVLHVSPTEEFTPPDGTNYAHLALVVDESIEEVKARLDEAGIEVLREGTPWGALGNAPAVYVEDPFGYTVEVKES